MGPSASTKELVLIGGGHSHALALRSFGMRPLPRARITLVSDVTHAPYSGMLPGLIAGFYTYDETHIDLRRVAAFAGARFLKARVTGLDLENRRVVLEGRPSVAFDLVSINVGSTPSTHGIPGADAFAIPAKPVQTLLDRLAALERAWSGGRRHLVVVGGGAGGVELALSLSRRFADKAEITLVQREEEILPTHAKAVRRHLARALKERGVNVLVGKEAIAVEPDRLLMSGGMVLPCDAVVWATHASAPPWIADSGLAVTSGGFVRVASTLQSVSHDFVFAAGDVATQEGAPRPKSGVFAVRQARPLAANLRNLVVGRRLVEYKPQRRFLSLIGTADGEAVASRGSVALKGKVLWRLKDRIDREFMAKFSELPLMERPMPLFEAPEEGMRCLGCGAKVGGSILGRALRRVASDVSPDERAQVFPAEAVEDASNIPWPEGERLLQSVDFFPSPVDDPFLFGRILTAHACNDLFAMGVKPHSALLTCVLPYQDAQLVEEDLYQVLSGVVTELKKVGATLLGGHTAEGDKLAGGLTVNGAASLDRVIGKRGARAGDALILTKALGTGVILAAAMRGVTAGRNVDAAIESMLLSNQSAAEILVAARANALTDVTGFGLAGHLLEMLDGGDLIACLDRKALPLLPGALEAIGEGVRSTLHAANVDLALQKLGGDQDAFAILLDPQTAGGLLAAVPSEVAEQVLTQLHKAGYRDAAIIGRLEAGDRQGARVVV